jgi:hypothetical protein
MEKLAKKEGVSDFYFIGILDFPWKFPSKDLYDAYTTNPPVGNFFDKLEKKLDVNFFNKNYKDCLDIYSYESFIKKAFPKKLINDKFIPCVVPKWDNTPRAGEKGFVLHGSTPELYKKHFLDAIEIIKSKKENNQIIFIKSWNEWAETNYLEPDLKWGRSYLEVTRDVLNIKNN